jgi:hypothetical protein
METICKAFIAKWGKVPLLETGSVALSDRK